MQTKAEVILSRMRAHRIRCGTDKLWWVWYRRYTALCGQRFSQVVN